MGDIVVEAEMVENATERHTTGYVHIRREERVLSCTSKFVSFCRDILNFNTVIKHFFDTYGNLSRNSSLAEGHPATLRVTMPKFMGYTPANNFKVRNVRRGPNELESSYIFFFGWRWREARMESSTFFHLAPF